MKLKATILAIGFIGLTMLSSCGSSGSTPATGNTVSGKIQLSDSVAAAKTGGAPASLALAAYQSSTVQLVDTNGNVVATTTTDASGQFTFINVAQGDYTINVIDPVTGAIVTQVSLSIVDGDNAYVEGTIDTTTASWTIDYTAGKASLQNDAQMAIAQNLADNSSLSLSQIIALRESGEGWGKIARDLGISPSVIGLGSSNGFDGKKNTTSHSGNVGHPGNSGHGNSGNAGGGNSGNGNSGGNGNGNSGNG